MAAVARVVLALTFTLFASRWRGLVLTLFALALVLAGAGASLFSTTMPIALFALMVGIATFLAIVLPRLLPRLFIALASTCALPFALIASWHGKLGFALAVAGLLGVFVLSVRKPDWMMRIAGASAGSLCLSGLFPNEDEHALPIRLGLIALLFALEELVRRSWPERAPNPAPIKLVAALGAAVAAAALLAVIALPLFATRVLSLPILSDRPDLPPLPYAGRRASLEQDVPRGGLIWPLPSEAISWDEPNLDRALFPRFDNLDALYLGVRTRGLLALEAAGPPASARAELGDRGGGKTAAREIAPERGAAWRWLLASISLHKPTAKLRLVHDEAALARLRAAAQATVAALQDVVPMIHAGTTEASLEAALKIAMERHGCGPESFPLIFASGASAAEPHGSGNLGTLQEGELLVADIGCTIDHYASDFTRTFPVSKKFSPRQKLLYDNVFAAQAAAIAQCKPGAMLDRGGPGDSLESTAREVLKARAPDGQAHMPHSLGHSVGLFVHDIWSSAPLEENNVITLEPGTYLPGELGIRIEDTFVVTKTGCEPLTAGFPAESDAIEARMAAGQAPQTPQ